MMPTKFLALFLLLVASAAPQNTPIPEEIPASRLPGGLKGEIAMLANNRNLLNIAVKITNESSRGDAFIPHAISVGNSSCRNNESQGYSLPAGVVTASIAKRMF